MIETWGFYLMASENPWEGVEVSPDSIQETFDTYLDIWSRCEDWGFDGIAFAEHHFNLYGLTPSPHLLVAAVAAKTKRLKLTILGSVLSMHDARRHAEEVGMLNYLTRGRFEPGIAPGAGVRETIAAGGDPAQIRPRYYSSADLLAKAIASRTVTHQDAFTNLQNVQIVPPLNLQAGQSVWVTALSSGSAGWAAERGFKMVTSWTSSAKAAALADVYRAAADEAGRAVDPSMLALRRRVVVADTDAEAQELFEQSTDLLYALAERGFEMADDAIREMMGEPDDFAIGSPETVAEKLIAQCREGGFGVMLTFIDFLQLSPAALARSHELVGTKVAPILRKADLGQVARPKLAA